MYFFGKIVKKNVYIARRSATQANYILLYLYQRKYKALYKDTRGSKEFFKNVK